jgi:hypothetical protein
MQPHKPILSLLRQYVHESTVFGVYNGVENRPTPPGLARTYDNTMDEYKLHNTYRRSQVIHKTFY